MQFVLVLVLFLIVVFRTISMRRLAHAQSPYVSCFTIGSWMLIVAALVYPLFQNVADAAFMNLSSSYLLLFVGLLKGVLFWVISYAGQFVRRTSSSSASFFGFVSLGFVAVGNFFMGEVLSALQWLSVVSLWLMGFYFVLRGHLSSQPLTVRLMFAAMVLVAICFGYIDHYFLSHSNWYGLLLLTGVGLTSSSIFARWLKVYSLKDAFMAPQSWRTGGLFAVTEIAILAILVTYLPVTVGVVAMTLAGPVMMVFASVFWGEGCWKQQLMVGSLSCLAAVPILIGL